MRGEDPKQEAMFSYVSAPAFSRTQLYKCFQQLQGLPWDCRTLESTGKTEQPWVIGVGDSVIPDRSISSR